MENNRNNSGYKAENITIDSKPYVRISKEGVDLAYNVALERYESLISRVDRMKEIAQKLVFGRTGYLYANDRTELKKYVSTPTEKIVAESIYSKKDPDETIKLPVKKLAKARICNAA